MPRAKPWVSVPRNSQPRRGETGLFPDPLRALGALRGCIPYYPRIRSCSARQKRSVIPAT